MSRFLTLLVILLVLQLTACLGSDTQSMLHPVSLSAERIAGLWWFMLAVLGGVTLAVFVLLFLGMRLRGRPPGGSTGFVVAGGIIVPALILVILLVVALRTTVALKPAPGTFTIQVIGHQWWWEVRYPEWGIVTANEIHVPVGMDVRLEVWSADVIHSFWVPRLHGKIDLLPDIVNPFSIRADRPGEYRGQCAEFCGTQHAKMAFLVVAMPPAEFEAWVDERRMPPEPPADPALILGHDAFFEAQCHACHAIRGTAAVGKVGPDLTHLGSRLTLGAGEIPNTLGNLQGWIANPQAIKPGNLMPRNYLPPKDLHAIATYLESLK